MQCFNVEICENKVSESSNKADKSARK